MVQHAQPQRHAAWPPDERAHLLQLSLAVRVKIDARLGTRRPTAAADGGGGSLLLAEDGLLAGGYVADAEVGEARACGAHGASLRLRQPGACFNLAFSYAMVRHGRVERMA
eukprot:224283-Chlamydomonas_euryale.AAC.2